MVSFFFFFLRFNDGFQTSKSKSNKYFYFRYEINAINNDDTEESDFEKEYWIQKMQTYATKLFEQEVTNVAALNAKNSEKQWLKTVLKSGTLTDKISAYSVLLQENPVANLASLEQLISMISLKSRRPCLMAIGKNHGIIPLKSLKNNNLLFFCEMFVIGTCL